MKNKMRSLFVSVLCLSMFAGYSFPIHANDEEVTETQENFEQVTQESGVQNTELEQAQEIIEESVASNEEVANDEGNQAEEETTPVGTDTTKPVFESFELQENGQTVEGGSEIHFTVVAYDADSDIQMVCVDLREEISGGYTKSYAYLEKVADKTYQGTYKTPEFTSNKVVVEGCEISDVNGNSLYTLLLGNNYFVNVVPKVIDMKTPTIKEIKFDKNHQEIGQNDNNEYLQVYLEGEGDFDQYINDINAVFKDDQGRMIFANGNKVDDYYNLRIYLSNLSEFKKGKHKLTLSSISISKKDNSSEELSLEGLGSFDFILNVSDTEAPVITDFQMTHQKDYVKTGDIIQVTIKAKDDGGLAETGSLYFERVNGGESRPVYLNWDENKQAYVGEYIINEDDYPTEWVLGSIFIQDKVGNRANEREYFTNGKTKSDFYYLVNNGDAFVTSTYNISLVLSNKFDSNSDTVQYKEKVRRRTTYKEAGFDLSRTAESPIEGLKFLGWVTNDGTLVTEDTEIVPDTYADTNATIYLYPKFEKNIIDLNVSYGNTSGEGVYKKDRIALPHDMTLEEVFDYLDEHLIYDDMDNSAFTGWAALVRPYIYLNCTLDISAQVKDKIVLTTGYNYLNDKGLMECDVETILVDKGITREELVSQLAEREEPSNGYKALGFKGWQDISGVLPDEPITWEQSALWLYAAYDKQYVRYVVDPYFEYSDGVGSTPFESEKYQYSYVETYNLGDTATIPEEIGKYKNVKLVFSDSRQELEPGTTFTVNSDMSFYGYSLDEEIPVDISELEAVIKEAELLDSTRYTEETWSKLETALKKAQEAVSNIPDTQEEVGRIKAELEAAIKGLEEKPVEPELPANKTELQNLINRVSELDESKYTEESWNALQEVLKQVQEVLENEEVKQEEVDAVANELKAAMDSLVVKPANKTELQKVIEQADGLDLSIYTQETRETLEKALNSAKEVMEDGKATQEQVDNITKELDKAIKGLVKEAIKLPEDKVEEVVDKITEAEEGSKVDIPMENATVVPKEVLEEAKGKDVDVVLDMGDYTWTINGKDVLSETENLDEINLEVEFDTDVIPQDIIDEVAQGKPVQQLSLTHNGNFGFKGTLTINVGKKYEGQYGALYYYDSDGKLVYQNSVSLIDENGFASFTFSHASDYVVIVSDTDEPVIPIDKSELEKLVKELEELDLSKYTEETSAALIVALDSARAVLENDDAMQQEVEKILDQLRTAFESLILKPADKTSLQKLIEEIKRLDSSKYTKETWENLLDALKKAEAVVANNSATQEEVDATIKELQDAIGALKEEIKEPEKPGESEKPEESGKPEKPEEPGQKPSDDKGSNKPSESEDDVKTATQNNMAIFMIMMTGAFAFALVLKVLKRKNA